MFRCQRFFLCILTLSVGALGTAIGWNGIATADEERPNVLFIIADDASRDSMGVYGSTYVETPNFDRIAREGVLFTQAYNCNPKCSPARACILTGRYSWQLEEACNHNPFLSDKWAFFPFLLEEAGYFIGYTGKGWGPGIHQGIDAGKSKFQALNPAGRAFNEKTLKPPYQGISNRDYGANLDDFLNAKPDGQPFCFWLGTHEPHRGYELDSWKKQGRDLSQVSVPAYYPDNEIIRGDLADYAIEVEWYDKWIGHALQTLETRGMLENTLIIVTSDHGMPFPRVKGQIYDDGFHIPMAARWGKRVQPGRVVTDFVTFPDLAPTFLELAGVPKHAQMTGQSFATQLLSKQSGRIDPLRNHTLLGKERHDIGRTDGDRLSVAYPSRAIRTDDYLYVRNFKPNRWPVGNPEFGLLNCDGSPTKSFLTGLSQIDPDFRFYELSFGKRPEEELYDMRDDPDCVVNLAEDRKHFAIKTELWRQLQSELTAQGDPRILGQGDIFDFYPNCRVEQQQVLYGRPDYDPVNLFQEKYGAAKEGNAHPESKSDEMTLIESDDTISLVRKGVSILEYRKTPPPLPEGMDPVYRRSGFLHPVLTPAGTSVTATYPFDHAHQHGIFTAWVRTTYDGQSIDFWNLAAGTGRVRHNSVVKTSSDPENLFFQVELIHEALLPKPVDVLKESWKVEWVAANDDYVCFDMHIEQAGLTDKPLQINEYHYGGFAVRGPTEWLVGKESNAPDAGNPASYFLNNLGSDRQTGNHQRAQWVALTGPGKNGPATIAVLSHPDNFRAPQAARLHPTKPYFCFAPCVDGEFIIDQSHSYSGKYRFFITDSEPDRQWLDARWREWGSH